MNRCALRYSLSALMLALSGTASAVGLGELRGQPVLGERVQLEIDLLGADKEKLDAACFRLVQPAAAGDLPWLMKAGLSVRPGMRPVLEIRSDAPLREPIMQLEIQLGCGHEISRDYILMALPGDGRAVPKSMPPVPVAETLQAAEPVRRPVKARPLLPALADASPRLAPARRTEKRPGASGLPDRLLLSEETFVGEPSLRLATDLLTEGGEAKEAQREILRLEFRMLMALHEQANSQMAAAEKLRNMEGTLGELQQHAAAFASRVEKDGLAPLLPAAAASRGAAQLPGPRVAANSPEPAAAAPAPLPESLPSPTTSSSHLSDWSLYGVLLGTVLGLAGWLGWRSYRARTQVPGETRYSIDVPEVKVDRQPDDEREEPGGGGLPFEPVATGMPTHIDDGFDLGNAIQFVQPEIPTKVPAQDNDSLVAISATTLDEQFEANPVMELADIMLSFGRVKGAAQALQEYIDHSPQEALQPWIRLLNVYRMAGMRAEFENVARNLNQNFNIEIQHWSEEPSGAGELSLSPRQQSLEDVPRLMNTVVELWRDGDVVGYLYQLLRDNRGGQRVGFAFPMVEDILFLIELKETANRIEKTS